MSDAVVIRIARSGTVRRGFDATVRTVVLPDLAGRPGFVGALYGRRGHDDEGPRTIVTLWASAADMVAGVGEGFGAFHPELLDRTADRSLEYHPVRMGDRYRDEVPRILRILRGTVRVGEMDEYVADMERGLSEIAAAGVSPVVFYLAETGPDAFISLSAWCTWDDLQQATGGGIDQPLAVRLPERLISWEVEFFEVVPI